MAIGSGLGASLGLADESTYGTYVAPTRFLEFEKEDLKKTKTTMQGGGLAAGRFAELASRRVLTSVGGTGSVDLEVTNKGFGLILARALGSTAAPVQQGATTAYLQTHVLADNYGQSMTVQKGVPQTDGTVVPYTFLGGKITAISFSCEIMGMLTSTVEFDFNDVTQAQSLAAPSFATGLAPFHGGQLDVRLGTFGAETSVTGIKKIDLKIERGMNTERFYASAAGFPAKKSEPIMNDTVKVTGTLTADFADATEIADLFANDTETSLVLEWTGPNIEGANDENFIIRVPAIFFDTDTPQVENADLVNTGFDFTGQHDGTNSLVSFEYMSTDTAI